MQTVTDQPTPTDALLDLRRSIDNIDAALVAMLAERFRCTKAVGALKDRNDLCRAASTIVIISSQSDFVFP